MADRCLLQTWNVKIWRLRKPALHNHSVALSGATVANRAIDVVALAAAVQGLTRNREWKCLNKVGSLSPTIEMIVRIEMSSRDCVRRNWPRDASVGEKCGFFERPILRMIEHAAPATGSAKKQEKEHGADWKSAIRQIKNLRYLHGSTSTTRSGSRLSRNRRVFFGSNFGSM